MTTTMSSNQVFEILIGRTAARVEEMINEVKLADKFYCWCSNYNDAISILPQEVETMAQLVVKINQLEYSKIAGAKVYNKHIEERITSMVIELCNIKGNPLMNGVGLNPEYIDLIPKIKF
jgi:hypothetical protein